MTITIGTPTVSFDRLSLLKQEVDSIEAGTYKDVHVVVVVDGDPKLYEAVRKILLSNRLQLSIVLNKGNFGWVASINRVFKEFDSEYYIYGSDDLIFPRDCIENAMVTMKRTFPDGYGVVSLGRKTKCIFGLVGRKWVEHFPERAVFCPFYTHYGADPEHYMFAKTIGKFTYPPERPSQVTHYRLNDKTRRFSRSSRTKDLALWEERKRKGLIWGISFERG